MDNNISLSKAELSHITKPPSWFDKMGVGKNTNSDHNQWRNTVMTLRL